jgi:peptide/nickel transport system substrate-binding protein
MLAVHSGQVDVAMTESGDAVKAFAGHPFLRVWQSAPLSIVRLAFNLDRAPFDRVEMRRAVAYAINRTQLASVIAGSAGLPGQPGLVASTDPWFVPAPRTYPHDPSRAHRLLEKPEGTAPEILASSASVAAVIQSMLHASGIDLVVRAVDPRTRAALVAEGKYQVALISHVGAGGDPDYLRRWLTGREPNLFGQTSAFRHPEFQRLADAQAAEMVPEARRRMIARMQSIVADELPTLALYNRRLSWVYDSRRLTPRDTLGGLMTGMPMVENKVALLER